MRSLYVKILFVFLLILSVIPASGQDDRPLKFNKGVELYTASDYEGALREWLDIYDTGYRSAELAYNIGNAYFKLNDVPGSILFYERARLLKPGDNNINYNLQITRTLVVDKFEEIPELFFVRWFDFLSLMLHTNTWAVISIITFIAFLILLSLYIYSSRYKLKVISFWTAVLLLFISASSLAFTLRNRSLVYDSREAVIFSPSVNGKSSPDASGTDLFVLHEGTKVSIEDKVGEWYEVKLSDGNKGWIPLSSLTII
ncbi:MAG TPA: SH3 domain-containing protein [Bacteroidales bacterium]|nr:SH3 domain-containing protein [Bacteroidales bacterium]